MSVCSCERCGKVIDENLRSLCPSCAIQEDIEFSNIRDYLDANPGATVLQLSTDLDIPIKNIKRYLRESRLQVVERDTRNNEFLTCIKCGNPITTGYYCFSCATSLKKANIKYSDADGLSSRSVDKKSSDKKPKETGIRFTDDKK